MTAASSLHASSLRASSLRVGMEVPARERITVQRLLAAIALVALSVVVQRDGWHDLAIIAFNDEEASHIFLVPIIVAWLFYVRRGRLRNCVGRFSFVGTLITAVGAWITYWGVGHGIQMSWHLGSVMMAAGCFITVMGFDFLREFFPCFLLLVFLVPVPSTLRIAISMPLEQFSAAAVSNVMQILGTDVQRSGNLLSVNGVAVTVAEACNGLRMVFGLILVAAAFVFGTPLRWQIRALILALSPVLAILLNIVRLVPTMFVFGHASHDTAEMFHDTSGWMMLPLAFLLLVGVQRLARWLCLPVMPYNVVYP